jgi:hypothetical protein
MNVTTTDILTTASNPPVWLFAQGTASKLLHVLTYAFHHLDLETQLTGCMY